MSTVKKKSKKTEVKTYAERCSRIIDLFNDKSKPIGTWDFKNVLFFCLHDALLHGDGSTLNQDHLATIYFLWQILDEIEALERAKT